MRISDWSSDVCSSDLRGVGRDVHQVGPVAQRSQLSRIEPRRARERGLPSEDAVELDGVAHRLVDLQRHLLAAEDEGGDGLGALRRAQQRLRLLGDAGAVADEVELRSEEHTSELQSLMRNSYD